MACEHTPCESFRAYVKEADAKHRSLKYVIGILIVVGGCGVGFAIDQSISAKSDAQAAKERASEIDSVNVRISALQEDVKEFKEMGRIIHATDKNVAVILEKVEKLERGE